MCERCKKEVELKDLVVVTLDGEEHKFCRTCFGEWVDEIREE